MKMKNFFIVPTTCNYISLGVIDKGEICYLDLNFINNVHNWGFTLVDADGKTYTKLNSHDDNIEMGFDFGGHKYSLYIVKEECRYEVIFTKIK